MLLDIKQRPNKKILRRFVGLWDLLILKFIRMVSMGELLYDYYPTLSRAKEAAKRIRRKGYHTAIRKVFMSDSFVLYIKDTPTRRDNDGY